MCRRWSSMPGFPRDWTPDRGTSLQAWGLGELHARPWCCTGRLTNIWTFLHKLFRQSAPLNPPNQKAIDKQPSNPHRIPGILPKCTSNQKQRCISELAWGYLQRSWCRKRLCKRGKSRLRKEDFVRRPASTLDGLTSARPNLCKKKTSLVLKRSFGFKSRWKNYM